MNSNTASGQRQGFLFGLIVCPKSVTPADGDWQLSSLLLIAAIDSVRGFFLFPQQNFGLYDLFIYSFSCCLSSTFVCQTLRDKMPCPPVRDMRSKQWPANSLREKREDHSCVWHTVSSQGSQPYRKVTFTKVMEKDLASP